MALIFCDSFDHYAIGDITQKWTSISSTSSASISSGNGRRSTSSLRVSTARTLDKGVASAQTYIQGVALRVDSLPSSVETFMAFLESATIHVSVRLNTDGSITVARNTTALGTSSAGIISANVYYYIEVKVKVDNTTGTYEVRVNGTNVLSGTGADTQNGGTATITNLRLAGMVFITTDFDDYYACDTTGSVNNDFIGDSRVDCMIPIGNGNSSQLDGSDGNSTDNYLLVDEASTDGDTTYVQSSTSGNKDTYQTTEMSFTPSIIHGVQVVAAAKKDDAGSRSITTVVRSGGTDYDGASQALSTSYAMYMDIHEVNPNTSAAWTKTNFDSAEFGVKVAA